MNFQYLFALGMKRHLPDLLTFDGKAVDVGASGKYVAPGAIGIGAPDWTWPRDPIPFQNDSVATLHAYHFMEHLPGRDAVSFLREVERVLVPDRGVFNFSVPYYSSSLAVHDLDHKSAWCEDTLRNLFDDDSYRHDGPWRLRVHFLAIVGIVQRNLCLLGQVIKTDRPKEERPLWHYPT